MKNIIQRRRIQKFDNLIKSEWLGTPKDYAYKLGISRSHLYRLIETLKDHGAPIEYSRKLRNFYYSRPFNLEKTLHIKPLSNSKMEDINGGVSKKFLPSHFFPNNTSILALEKCFSGEFNYQLIVGSHNLKIASNPIF